MQGPRETLDEYLGAIEKQSLRTGKMSEQQIIHATLNGLRPGIRQQVLQHEPTSLLDIRRWGTIAESSEVNNSDHTTNAVLKDIQSQLARMQITPITNISTTTETNKPVIQRTEEQQAVKTYSNGSNNTGRNNNVRRNNNHSHATGYQTRNNLPQSSQPGYNYTTGPAVQAWENYTNAPRQRDPTTGGKTYYNQPVQQYNGGSSRLFTCFYCNNIYNNSIRDHVRTCAARSSTCSYCNRVGHVAAACRSARYPTQ